MHWNHATLESLCGSTWLSSSFKEMSRWRRRWTRMWRWWTSGWRCWKLPSLCFNRCTWLASYYKEMRIKEKSKSFRHVDPFPRATDVLSRREELCFIMQTRQFHRRVDSTRQNWDPLMLSQGALEPPQGDEASVPRAPNLVRPLILLWYHNQEDPQMVFWEPLQRQLRSQRQRTFWIKACKRIGSGWKSFGFFHLWGDGSRAPWATYQ